MKDSTADVIIALKASRVARELEKIDKIEDILEEVVKNSKLEPLSDDYPSNIVLFKEQVGAEIFAQLSGNSNFPTLIDNFIKERGRSNRLKLENYLFTLICEKNPDTTITMNDIECFVLEISGG